MTKRCEVNANMGRKLLKPYLGNMSLTRSRDRKIVSVTNFEKDNKDGQYFRVYAWQVINLKTVEISEAFHKCINQYYVENRDIFGEVIEVSFCDKKRLIQLIYV